jgi:chemotaxis protein MotB
MPGRGGGGDQRPLVIKRVIVGGHGGHHGGAWKVAYADFVTAMMAFFLLLWLISSASEDTLKGLSEYFSEAKVNVGTPGGAGGLLDGRMLLPSGGVQATTAVPILPLPPPGSAPAELEPSETGLTSGLAEDLREEAFEAELERREQATFEAKKEAIEAALEAAPELSRFAENLLIDRTPEGLRIQIVDLEDAAMFPVGSDQMYPHTLRLLEVVERAIADLPNRVSIRGHTDALPFAAGATYDNWRLSSDRANATRLALVGLGLPPGRVADVTGKADAESLFPDDPRDPRNRRISLVLLNERPLPTPSAPVAARAATGAANHPAGPDPTR